MSALASRPEGCKGCRDSVHVPEAQIDRMIEKLERHPESCAPTDQYEARLASCAACADLQYGSTCAHCGCFVRVRAKLLAGTCPKPGGSKWA
ncbi:DUF6171 family protein [Paenibacillus xanthanilyticus]|uniref:DUF6171 family protein n=1 Tax=Paenibacillus xanthanilyticus TaxID=1783531 RepID=A0ABV8K1V9_9BACL